MTALLPSPVTVAAWFRNARIRFFTVAMSLATFAPVFGQPIILQQPQNQTNLAGTTATFAVIAQGIAGLSYQWRSYANATTFTDIYRADNSTLVLNNVQPTTHLFAVVVTDGSGLSVTSSPLVTLTVVAADIFTKVTDGPGSDAGYSRGGAWGDYNNDGFIDLFVANLGPGGSGSASHFLYPISSPPLVASGAWRGGTTTTMAGLTFSCRNPTSRAACPIISIETTAAARLLAWASGWWMAMPMP